jgi:hypothetical protein
MGGTQIYLKRDVVAVAVVLPISDAVSFVRDARKLQEDVADMLRGGGVDPQSGKLIGSTLLDGQEGGVRGLLGAAPASTKPERKKYERKPGPMTNCPECGKPFKVGGLKLHMHLKHGIAVPLPGAVETTPDARLDAGMEALEGES